MLRRACLLIAVLAAVLPLLAQEPPRAQDVIQAFRRIAAQPLWPGFEPATTPVEFFDGTSTWLFNHPAPPEGFHPVPGQPGVFVFPGQHDSVRANTGTLVNGVPTATADLSHTTGSPDELAALLLHEAFHVFEKKAYPKWSANEVDLFTYPVDDASLLADRWLETLALVRALAARDRPETRCWAETALAMREKRFAALPATASGYERAVEEFEGLAQYLQFKSIGKPAALTADDFPPGQAQVRQRGYATGQAFALLLDRLDPEWKSKLAGGQTSLDQMLDSALKDSRPAKAADLDCRFSDEVRQPAQARAQRDVAALAATLARQKQEFLGVPGTRLEIVAGREPLWPQAFDPWNVLILSGKEVLHTRWLKLGNGAGAIEVLDRSALTEAAGAHPLFNGVRQVTVTGLADPQVTEAAGKVTLETQGVKATFQGSVERQPGLVRIILP